MNSDFDAGAARDLEPIPQAIGLSLRVTDPELIAEIGKHASGPARDAFAMNALRLGVLSLRLASGQLDTGAIREAGNRLVSDVGTLLENRGRELARGLADGVRSYFDPASGRLQDRLEKLTAEGGELQNLLKAAVGKDDSTLAKTLAGYLGSESPVLRMLDPTNSKGLRSQVEDLVTVALENQRKIILQQFTLDDRESALSRLAFHLRDSNSRLGLDLKEQVEFAVREFSLDAPDSALSRLVAKVELAQRSITDQFSMDAEGSALSRLSGMMSQTRDRIDASLTLDEENSSLSRLKRALETHIDELAKD